MELLHAIGAEWIESFKQLSLESLIKLKMSRQNKTIEQADLIMNRLKNKNDDDDIDIDLIEQQ